MKTALILFGVGAAVAGLMHYLKDNENVQELLDKAKDTASGTIDSLKETFTNAARPTAEVTLDQ
jgi:hypothetical protein